MTYIGIGTFIKGELPCEGYTLPKCFSVLFTSCRESECVREAMALHNPDQCVYIDCEEHHAGQPDEDKSVLTLELQEVGWEEPNSLEQGWNCGNHFSHCCM